MRSRLTRVAAGNHAKVTTGLRKGRQPIDTFQLFIPVDESPTAPQLPFGQ